MSTSVQQCSCPRLKRIGNPRDLAAKGAIGNFRHTNHRLDARRQTERPLVLRHIDLGADHIALLDREHESAAYRIGLHQAAHIDIALGDHSVERRDDLLIGFLLLEHQGLRLLRRHVALSDADRRFLRSQRLHVHRTLLRGPALFNQRTIAVPCNLRQFGIGSRLLQSCLKLNQGALGLGNLIELGAAISARSYPCLTWSPISTFRLSI